MKKIMLLLIALIVCAAPLVSLAERSALSRQEKGQGNLPA